MKGKEKAGKEANTCHKSTEAQEIVFPSHKQEPSEE